jgi:amidase
MSGRPGALNQLGATALVRLIRAREVSPVEVLRDHLAAIERFNPAVNAVCTLAREQAVVAAKAAEEAVSRKGAVGLLCGVPVGIKDVTPTAGIRTTFGSPLFAEHVPDVDAAVVARLKAAGAVILGKTNTPEFATGANTVNRVFGATRNPWNLALSAGGSTGGGAAALACGMIALAEGTDFGGSLRVPAAFCGLVGLRPTAGLVPSHPVPLPWDAGRVHGPMARRAEDAALMLDAVVGLSDLSPLSVAPPWHDIAGTVAAASDAKGLRVAYCPDIAGVGIDAEIEGVCRAAARALVAADAEVEEIAFDLSDGRDAYVTLRGEWMVEQYYQRLGDIEAYDKNMVANVKAGLALTVRDLGRAESKKTEHWHRWRRLFERFDLLLTPTVPVPPFSVEENAPAAIAGRAMKTYIDWIAPTFLVTLSSLPACSVPCGRTRDGLPIGLQIVGRRFAEPQILSLAKLVQDMHPLGWPPLVERHA